MRILKPKPSKTLFNLSNQAGEACFKPYNAFDSLQTWLGASLLTKPCDCTIKMSSNKSPFKKTLLKSNCQIGQWFDKASSKMIRVVASLITRLNVST